MTTIDEIMACVYRSQFAASAYEASYGPGTGKLEIDMFAADGEVQALITQAIAEARAAGAREMQIDAGRMCAAQSDEADGDIAYRDACNDCAKSIRAMPLPTGERQAVLLTDDAVAAACRDIAIAVAENCGSVPQLTHPHIYLGVRKLLAVNGLEVRRG